MPTSSRKSDHYADRIYSHKGTYLAFLQQFRLPGMCHTATTVELKKKVLQSFYTMDSNCNDCFRLGYRQTIKGYITGAHQVIWIPMSKKVEKAGRDQQQSSGVLWYGKVPATNAEMWYYAETAQCIRATLFKDFLLGQDVQPIIPGYICCDICQA